MTPTSISRLSNRETDRPLVFKLISPSSSLLAALPALALRPGVVPGALHPLLRPLQLPSHRGGTALACADPLGLGLLDRGIAHGTELRLPLLHGHDVLPSVSHYFLAL